MSEYTPDTDDIKLAYKEQCNHYYAECEIKPKEHAAEFDRWLAKHDAEVAEAERERILRLLRAHSNETWEEYNSHEEGCALCQNYYGIGVAIKLIKGENE